MSFSSPSKLKHIANYIARGDAPVYSDELGVPIINQSCIWPKKLDLSKVKYHDFHQIEKIASWIHKGDILINSTGTGTLGRVSIVELEPVNPTFADAHVTIVRDTKSRFFPKFLFYHLAILQNVLTIICSEGATNQIELSRFKLGNLEFGLPTLGRQALIANYLDQETAKIDSMISAKERLLVLLTEKRQALITHAVTRGLNPNVPLRDSGIDWLGDIPEHWETAGFLYFLDSIVDYRGRTPEKAASGVFLVTARNIKSGRIDYEASQEYIEHDVYEEAMSRGKPKLGDLVFTTEAPLGQVALIDHEDIALAQRVIKIDYDKNVLLNEFVMFWMMSSLFQWHLNSLATGSTAVVIKAEKLSELRNIIPPLDEQIAIISYIKQKNEKLSALYFSTKSSVELLQERRTALISAAVTGQINIPQEQLYATK
jgi:type I restriction enzyme, S subunit